MRDEGLKSALIGISILASAACGTVLLSYALPLCASSIPLWAFSLLLLGALPALTIPYGLGILGVTDWLQGLAVARREAREKTVREVMES